MKTNPSPVSAAMLRAATGFALAFALACSGPSVVESRAPAGPDWAAMRATFAETGEVPPMLLAPEIGPELLPVEPPSVALDTPEGAAVLERARQAGAAADYDALEAAFESQRYRSYCGVASSVIALRAMGDEAVSQESFFDESTDPVAPQVQVLFGGMTLDTLARLLEARGAEVEVYHASDLSLDAFRALASANLAREGDYVVVNYYRPTVAQEGGGHISPLGAYDAESDAFLLLDVAAYKYPPMWVDAEDLFAAMNEVDSESGRSRGAVFVAPR